MQRMGESCILPLDTLWYDFSMDQKTFNGVAGIIFLLIAVLHALRLLYGWGAGIGGWVVPMWFSWAGVVITGYLAWSAFRLKR